MLKRILIRPIYQMQAQLRYSRRELAEALAITISPAGVHISNLNY
jgi:hypothetical protein